MIGSSAFVLVSPVKWNEIGISLVESQTHAIYKAICTWGKISNLSLYGGPGFYQTLTDRNDEKRGIFPLHPFTSHSYSLLVCCFCLPFKSESMQRTLALSFSSSCKATWRIKLNAASNCDPFPRTSVFPGHEVKMSLSSVTTVAKSIWCLKEWQRERK